MTLFSWGLIISSSHLFFRLIWRLLCKARGFVALLSLAYSAQALAQVQALDQAVAAGRSEAAVELRIGVQQLDYYPHFDFSAGQKRGYFVELMRLFARSQGYQIRFVPLPVKRLYQELDNGLDLVYPDNPAWPNDLPTVQKVFSEPVVFSLGSSMVRPEKAHYQLSDVQTVAFIHGFTPTKWLAASRQFRFEMVDVADTGAALGLVLKGRVDATPVELNVANAWLARQQQPGALIVAHQLPFTQLPFLLSTLNRPELIDQFNQFLRVHAGEIAALKKRFALQENRPDAVTLKK